MIFLINKDFSFFAVWQYLAVQERFGSPQDFVLLEEDDLEIVLSSMAFYELLYP